MMGLREFVELFDKNEVKNLFNVLNHKIWQHHESNRKLAALYDRLWREADEYAMNNFKGEELDYYYRITD
jgi:hypothetical protein